MTLEQEILVWIPMMFSILVIELTGLYNRSDFWQGFIGIVSMLILSFVLAFVFITSRQIATYAISYTFILSTMSLVYGYTKNSMTLVFRKLFILDIGIFQGTAALLVYKFV